MFAVYAGESYHRAIQDNWDRNFSNDKVVLIDSVISTFDGVRKEWKDRGSPLNFYKESDPQRIIEAIDQVEWRQPVARVGGELLSSLILKHPFPNAHHRTAVAYLRTYLQSMVTDPDA